MALGILEEDPHIPHILSTLSPKPGEELSSKRPGPLFRTPQAAQAL